MKSVLNLIASRIRLAWRNFLWATSVDRGMTCRDIGSVFSAVAGPIIGGLFASDASENASQAQVQAGQDSSATQLNMYNQNRADMAPWRETGVNALQRLNNGMNAGGDYTKSFGMSDFTTDPGYNFRLSEGLKALEKSAAAKGMLMSGATGKGLQRYGQDYASGEYTNAFNRFQLDKSNRFNRDAALAGIGQTAAQQLAQQGTQVAANVGENIVGAGNARASGMVGGANAMTGAIGQGMNFYNQGRLLDQLQSGNNYRSASSYSPSSSYSAAMPYSGSEEYGGGW